MTTRPNGYAYFPGTGPGGETCGSCRHALPLKVVWAKRTKCALYPNRTPSKKTDIELAAPACSYWKKK